MEQRVIGVRSSQKTGAQSAVSTVRQKGVTVQYSGNEKASNRQRGNFHRVKSKTFLFFSFFFLQGKQNILQISGETESALW